MTKDTQVADAFMAIFGFKRVEQDKQSDAPLPVPCKDEQPVRVYTKG